jgi:transposase
VKYILLYGFSTQKVNAQWKFTKKIVAVYGDVMNWQNVTKWCSEFSEGRTDVHDEQRSGRPSLISDDILQKTEGEIHSDQREMIRELHHIIPKVSKPTIHEAVT